MIAIRLLSDGINGRSRTYAGLLRGVIAFYERDPLVTFRVSNVHDITPAVNCDNRVLACPPFAARFPIEDIGSSY